MKTNKWLTAAASGFRPMRVGAVEFFLLRLGFAFIAWQSITKWKTLPFDGRPHPAGLARLMDLTWLNDPEKLVLCQTIAFVALLVYVTGRFLWAALPVVCFIDIAINSFYNSQGFTYHGHQLLGLTLFAQTVVVLVMAVRGAAQGAIRDRAVRLRMAVVLPGLLLFYSQMAIAGAYAVSVVSKMQNTKGRWFARSHYHAGQLIKTDRQHYYTSVPPGGALGQSDSARRARLVADHPHLARIAFGVGACLEFLVFLGLKNRRWALGIGFAIVALHHSIYVVMRLAFPLNEMLAILFFVNPAYWLRRSLPGGRQFSEPLPPDPPGPGLSPPIPGAAGLVRGCPPV